jgi:hypothetical protein
MGNYKGKTKSEYYAEWQKKNEKRQNAYKLEWRRKNIEKVRKQALDWYYRQIGNPEFKKKVRERSIEFAHTHPEWVREKNRINGLKKFDLTKEDYEKLLEIQGGKCAICGVEYSGKKKRRLSVDHDHKTGKVRGILCHDCNWMIGYLERKESPATIIKLIEYLITHNRWE